MDMGWFKSEAEKWAEAKLDPARNARLGHGKVSANQLRDRQIKAADAKNARKQG